MIDIKNCNNCKLINLTEEQQVDKKVNHVCLKYNKRVFHRSDNPRIQHNYIYPCEECNGNDFIERNTYEILQNLEIPRFNYTKEQVDRILEFIKSEEFKKMIGRALDITK